MRFTVFDCEQRSEAWFTARAGRLTSSEAHVIFMQGRSKGSESVMKRDLRLRLALEQIGGKTLDNDDFTNRDIQNGIDREPDARLAYEAYAGVLLREVGFVASDELLIGASPDGVVDFFEGGAEIKCPKTATHLAYLRNPTVPEDYEHQMRHLMLVTGAQWWDFVSFDDRIAVPSLQLVVRRLWAKDAEMAAYAMAVTNFLNEVAREKAEILKLAEAAA